MHAVGCMPLVLTSRRVTKTYQDFKMALSSPQKRVQRLGISLGRLCCKNSTFYLIFEDYQPQNMPKCCAATQSSPAAADTSSMSTAPMSPSTLPAPIGLGPAFPMPKTLGARNCKRQHAFEGCLGAGERGGGTPESAKKSKRM